MKGHSAHIERLNHIIQAIDLIDDFMAGVSYDQFAANTQLQSAVLYQFMIIGEAVRNIEPQMLANSPYPWHKPRSFRNFIAHEYHNIKFERVYAAIEELQSLKEAAGEVLKYLKDHYT